MKRMRDEKYSGENSVKLINSGKVLYRCTFCTFVACTEHNIDHHIKTKHQKKDEDMNSNIKK